ncbi:T9SS type A sorting domain-containing protein [Cytophaga aurantiaca]|uniref:rhamnogalacturonan lyase family protein n=1 Tax=Cytophaga aurantiaca TaxID=29530 RepID=UPI0003772EB6|nr:T9SS type A sorting domain-containing protein [Cytophaga aurantiaca]
MIPLLLFSFQETFAQMQLEKLDRGVTAVSMGGAKVFVSWRWLGTEDDITFNLYRNGTKINATPLTVSNYTDNAGSTTASYSVTTIVNGVEQAASAGVTPWAQQYLKVPITAPAGGTTPDGIAYTYEANDASIADLDGDGQWEIILKWNPTNAKDNSQSGYTGNTYIDAYKMNGTRMWRIDFGRNIRSGAHYLDFMVYDFDGDGQAEMMARTAEATIDGTGVVIGNANADYRTTAGYILTGPEYITVFNGKTGKAMATKNLYPPRGVVADWGDNYGNRVDRFKACVAYLDGQRPSGVFTRGYYAKWGAEAIDWRNGQLTTRWTFMVPNNSADPNYSEGAHSLSVADVDGDGKQEVITGSLILDDNGTVYYNTNIGHGDALHVSDLDPDLAGLEISHIQEPVGNAGLYMYSGKTKNVLWRKATAAGETEGPGRGVCADISAQYRGAESWCAGGGIPGVFDCKGTLTTLAAPQSCNFLAWWDGDVLRELLNNTMIDKYGTGRLLTAYNIAPIASNNGTKSTPCLSGDIMGDWREEVIWRAAANDALYIFTTTTPSTYKFRTLMQDPQYRVAIAWQNTGYNQPPHLSYYLGDGMATPVKPNIAVIPPANLATCSATITSPSTAMCAGGSVVLTASSGASYKWFNGTTQVGTASTYTATAAGSYTVEVTTAAGCKATSAIKTITVNPLPVITQYIQVNAGAWLTAATASVCEGNTVNLGPHPNLAAGWSWIGPNNFTSTLRNPTLTNIVVANAGNYIATYTDANGCKATSTFVLQVTKPTASITSPVTSFCAGGSVVLSANTGTGLTYQWSNAAGAITGATNATYTATAAGAYTVEVTNTAGCKATSAVTQITVNATPIATITSTATAFCTGGSVMFTSSTGASYKWFNGTTQVGTAATYTATAAGAYTVEVTNASGCKATSTITQISVNTLPTATITAPATSFCTGGSVVLTASAGTSYKWFNGTTQVGTAATYTATTAGAYTVEVTNAAGCKATSAVTQITVNATPTAIITSTATSFCTGGSVMLTSSTGTSYKWFNGTTQVGTAASYTANAAGAYTVEVTNAAGCKATSAVTQIDAAGLPIAIITSPSTSFCNGGSVVLTSSAGTSYKWFNGTTQVGTAGSYKATVAGLYTVEVTNSAGCKATSTGVTITENTAAIATPTITAPATSFCAGGSVILSSSTGASYKWFNGTIQIGSSSAYTATAAGSYTVEVTNASGCKATSAPIQISIASTVTWYADADNDGLGDITNTLNACTKPSGYVAVAGDLCPADAGKTEAGNCGCGHTEASCLDCNGTPNGTAFIDNCSVCVGGTTGNIACVTTATINGTSATIHVVPQPFDANTTITVENYGMIQSYTIISASGALVETRQGLNSSEITVGEGIASGLYTVILITEKGTYTTKIVKR